MKKFDEYLIPQSFSIAEAISLIDKGKAKIALVIDDNGRLIGTVTDGDIRRGLLSGKILESPVELVMQRNFHALSENDSESHALRIMHKNLLRQIPVLDDNGSVVRLILLEELMNPLPLLPNWVVFMAGGKGKRLYPLTENCPKPMLKVGDKPMLEILLEQCILAGLNRFYFSVNYLKEQIIEFFGDGSRWDVQINYLEEGITMGTAGALSLLEKIPEDPLLILNGDVLTRVDLPSLLRFHKEHQSGATMCVRKHEMRIPFGVVHNEGIHVKSLEEKPLMTNFINAGLYVLNPEFLQLIPPNQTYDMPQLLESAIKNHFTVTAYPIHEYWLDVGHHDSLDRANGEWR